MYSRMDALWLVAFVLISCKTTAVLSISGVGPDCGSGGSGCMFVVTSAEISTQQPTITSDIVEATSSLGLLLPLPDITTTTAAVVAPTSTIASTEIAQSTEQPTITSDSVIPTPSSTTRLATSTVTPTPTSAVAPSLTTIRGDVLTSLPASQSVTQAFSTSSQTLQTLSTQSSAILRTSSQTLTQTSSVSLQPVASTAFVSTSALSPSPSPSLPAISTSSLFPTPSMTPTIQMPGSLPSWIQAIVDFFQNAPQEAIIGIGVGGAVILILLFIVILLCCCCLCNKLRKRKRRKYDVHNVGLSISNPHAITTDSFFPNGTTPAHYHHLDNSYELGPDQYDLHAIEAEHASPTHYNRYQQNMFRETAIDVGGPSQPQHSQMSVGTDIFREGPLPKLSPLSYSSQLVSSTAPGFTNHGLSVDDNIESTHHLSLGNIGPSPVLSRRFPSSSPSLRVPTRMALSLQNEESKSAQGSRASIHGSKTSFSGSRPSIMGSGSRSQIHGSSLSREFSSSLLSGHREEEDTLSLPLSGHTISPPPQQNSLESMEIPTRDSPLSMIPIATSHSIGHGKQDFASLTCIPNHLAFETQMNESPEKHELIEHEKPVEKHRGFRRRSLQDFGALTTLEFNEADGAPEVRPRRLTEVAIPEEKVVETPKEKRADEKKSDAKSGSTKKKARAMSRLEKLTSIENYIRASLRLKKKKVSFESDRTDNAATSPKKDSKDVVVVNKGAMDRNDFAPPLRNGDLPNSPDSTLSSDYRSPRNSTAPGDVFSPTDYHDDHFTDTSWHPRNYSDNPYGFLQLSQPTFYGGHMVPQPPYQQHGYPQLSQQYYPQMRPSYPMPPHPHHLPIASPFRRGGSEYSHNGRYRGSGTPDFSDITTPEHEVYSNKERRTSDHLLEGEQPSSYHYPHGYPHMDSLRSPNGYNPGGDRVVSPDTLTETSTTSARYHTRSPDLFDGLMPPHLHSHGNRDSFASDVFPQGPNSADHYTGGGVPTYPMDLLYSPRGPVGNMESYGGNYPYENRRSSTERYEQQERQYNGLHPHSMGLDYDREKTPDHYMTSPKHYAMRSNRRHSGERRTSGYSDSSVTSGERAMTDNSSSNTSNKNKVSWSTEVIEYPRTPSDIDESDFDFNHL